MKILHVIDSGGFYGAEAMLVELAVEQIKAGHSVTVCSIGTPGEPEKPVEKVCKERGVNIYPLRMKAGLNLFGGMKIVHYAKQHGFDLFHSHGYKGNILLGILPTFIRSIPLVTTLHGWTATSGLTKMKIYEMLDALLLSRMDCVVLVSDAMANRKEIVGRNLNLLTIIGNGISTDTPESGIETSSIITIRQLKRKGLLVGSIGRLSYEKGFDLLLLAFKKLLASVPTAKLVLVGEGRLRNDIEDRASELGVSEHVYLLGYVIGADKLIPEFDVYVNSSRTEGTAITLLEAMRSKVPIIASKVGGNITLLADGKFGHLYDVEDTSQLAEKMLLVTTKQDSKRVDEAYEYFCKNHSSEAMCHEYLNLYDTLLKTVQR